MRTGNLRYYRAFYNLKREVGTGAIKILQLINQDIKKDCGLFTALIRIEKDNGNHDRSRYFDYWLYFRNTTNWKTCYKSGLAITIYKNVFEGNLSKPVILNQKNHKGKDFENPKHFMIVQSFDNFNLLVIDLFPNFYPVNRKLLNAILREHSYLNRIKKGA